jgi:hypothetical protein
LLARSQGEERGKYWLPYEIGHNKLNKIIDPQAAEKERKEVLQFSDSTI